MVLRAGRHFAATLTRLAYLEPTASYYESRAQQASQLHPHDREQPSCHLHSEVRTTTSRANDERVRPLQTHFATKTANVAARTTWVTSATVAVHTRLVGVTQSGDKTDAGRGLRRRGRRCREICAGLRRGGYAARGRRDGHVCKGGRLQCTNVLVMDARHDIAGTRTAVL